MSDFSETWKAMSVEQRARHILQDWQDSRECNDPMVLRVAAAVAHAVLQELVSKADELRAERDEEAAAAAAEIERLRAERDEVRQSYCSLMEAYRGGDGRVTANKLGWGYLFPRRPKKEDGK